MSALSCSEFDDLVAELALDTLPGDERARALTHVDECPHCRGALEELSDVADSLLLLAPEISLPSGLVVGVAAPPPPRQVTRWRRVASATAAAAVIAGIGLGVTTDADTRRAPVPPTAAASTAAGVLTAQFVPVGTETLGGRVFAHAGSQSWVLMTVRDSGDGEPYRCELDLRGDRRLDLGTVHLEGNSGTWGRPIPVDAGQIERVRLVDPTGTTVAVAAFA